MPREIIANLVDALKLLDDLTGSGECFCELDGYKCVDCTTKQAIKQGEDYLNNSGTQTTAPQVALNKQPANNLPNISLTNEDLEEFFS